MRTEWAGRLRQAMGDLEPLGAEAMMRVEARDLDGLTGPGLWPDSQTTGPLQGVSR